MPGKEAETPPQQLRVSKRKAFLTQEISVKDYSRELEAISIKSTLQK